MVRPANMEPLEYGQHTVVVKVNGMRVCHHQSFAVRSG